jgi:hypothetical protein
MTISTSGDSSQSNSSTQPQEIDMREELKKRILKVIDEIDKGFARSMLMYTISFYVGIGVVIYSIVSTIAFGQNSFNLIFGAIGVLDIIAFLIFKPTQDLQRSRGNLAQLISAFLTWYSNMTVWSHLNTKILNSNDFDIALLQQNSKRTILDTVVFMAAVEFFVIGSQKEEQLKQIQAIMKDIESRAGSS